VTLEVYSWWRETSERDAFENVIRIHEDTHPGVEVVNRADPTAKDLRKVVAERILASAVPSTFQANVGADLLRWSVVDTDDGSVPSANFLTPLSALFERGAGPDAASFGAALPPVLARALSAGPEGAPLAVPLNLHRLNVLYFNPSRVSPELLRIERLCPSAPAAPLDFDIAIGLEDPHTLFLLAFENVLPALAGAKFYDDLFRGRPTAGWEAEVSRALACVQYLSKSFRDSGSLTWSDAAERVANNQADFTVTGDWANGELSLALAAGTVESMPFPGTEGTFVFTADTFPMPRGGPNPAETMALLETMLSLDAQRAFSAQKGSIPARFDVDLASLGERAQRTRADFLSAEPVLATSGLLPPYYPLDAVADLLSEMVGPSAGEAEIAAVLRLMRDAEPLLSVWQARLQDRPVMP
jgi:glucose/mannose transport system substrate-binding protein